MKSADDGTEAPPEVPQEPTKAPEASSSPAESSTDAAKATTTPTATATEPSDAAAEAAASVPKTSTTAEASSSADKSASSTATSAAPSSVKSKRDATTAALDGKQRASKKRSRSSPANLPPADASDSATTTIPAAAAVIASQFCTKHGLPALAQWLSSPNNTSTLTALPSKEHLTTLGQKAVQDAPPYVHLSKTDTAPQLKMDERRLTLKGILRGYRMSRASHGVSTTAASTANNNNTSNTANTLATSTMMGLNTHSVPTETAAQPTTTTNTQQQPQQQGNYYYEIEVLEPPPVQELIPHGLPPNARFAKGVQQELDKAKQLNKPIFAHLRVGWSMRTGDLQAPVGYDKWSYAIRDQLGSKLHQSKREDHWGGESFGVGDVVGLCITTSPKLPKSIRFFRNGKALGQFVISKGKREGGAAFEHIQDGTYYPAISTYMGATCRVNFGPYFCYPPRKLPSAVKVQPISTLAAVPTHPEQVVALLAKEKGLRNKPDVLQALKELIQIEAQIWYQAHQQHLQWHLQQVQQARQARNLSLAGLPESLESTQS